MSASIENEVNVTLSRYDVVAEEGDSARFIRHTGLGEAGTHTRRAVPVTDMGPPFHRSYLLHAYAVGRIALEEGELRKIKDFIDRHEGEHKAISRISRSNFATGYCIFPHAVDFRESDGRYVRRRFSCSGFVFEAYKRARINLVKEDQLPTISLDQIKQAYREYSAFLDDPPFRERMGLNGDGPWPVLLCGYLINSLSRDENAIRFEPYAVAAGDELFPPS